MKFYFGILCDKGNILSNIVLCDVTSCAICLSNKVKYLQREESYKKIYYLKSYIVILSDLCNAVNKTLDKISSHISALKTNLFPAVFKNLF